MDKAEITAELKTFMEERILKSTDSGVDAETPLLEWGLLNSLGTAELLAFVRQRYDIFVPPDKIVGTNFRTLNAVADLVLDLRESQTEPAGARGGH